MLCTSYSASNAQDASALDPTQVYSTGNLVTPTGSYSTWTNAVFQDSLTCWSWGNPGYCGPNAIVRPGDNINFSFGLTDIYQIRSIADALPYSGTGLRVNGYNFSFTAKNGNGWDDGRVDYLIAYVKFYGSNGSMVVDDRYDLNYKFNWTSFNLNQTFQTPFATKDLSAVQYGFVGRDNNGWAGPYGPEIYNTSFSLKYSVDTCALDVFSSPSCPGYLDALGKLMVNAAPVAEPISTPTEPVAATPTASTYQLAAPTTASPTNPSTTETTSSSSSSVSTAAPTVSAAPTATNPQPKIGEVATAGSTKPTVSMSLIMSVVNAEQSRVQQAEKMVAEQVKEISAAVTANAEATALGAAAQSATSSQISALQSSNANSVVSNSLTGVPGASLNVGVATSAFQAFGVPDQAQVGGEVMSVAALKPPAPLVDSPAVTTEKKPTEDVVLKDLVLGAPTIEQVQDSKSGPVVNSKTKDNDAAGGVTIAAIATVPVGYQAYSIFSLKDIPFYPTQSLYKNQQTTDNQRILRMMNAKSDQLHQQMVDQQYK